jgi:hypothetical protein
MIEPTKPNPFEKKKNICSPTRPSLHRSDAGWRGACRLYAETTLVRIDDGE